MRFLAPAAAVALTLMGLYLASRYSYNLFHSFAELFAIIVAMTIFVIAWNTRFILTNHYFIFVGVALLFVGAVDTLHLLAYKGMGVFDGYDANLPTQLWLAARFLQVGAFLSAPLLLGRMPKLPMVVAGFAAVTGAMVLAIFTGYFPDAFVEGQGLTLFKKASEYALCLAALVALLLLRRERMRFEPLVVDLLQMSMLLTIAAELSFTLYVDVYGLFNLLGHFLKIAAFYLIYKALVETALVRPFSLLFRELKQSEAALRESEERYRTIAEALQEAILVVPESLPGVEYAHLYRSATVAARVGGDFYDVFEIDDRILGIIMGDVSGKGLSAATLTSLVKDTIRAYAYDGDSPALVMEKTNEVIVRSSEPSSFVTAFFGLLDRETGELTYSSAGHPPAILARHGRTSRFLPSQSPVLGAFQGLLYREERETLTPGDTLFLYTDGVTEAREGAVFFGEERLLDNLQGLNGASPRDVVNMVFADILTHTRGNLSDDMALFTVRLG